MKYGYARVSTEDQDPAMQIAALKKAGCDKIFKDEGISGSATKRPAFERLLRQLRAGDTVTIWKLDRMGRNLRDLVNIMHGFGQGSIQFRSLTEEINTKTLGGTLLFHFIGAVAQYEHGLIRERTRTGIRAAKARGVRFGRKPKLSKQQVAHAIKLIDAGDRATDIADSFNVSRATLYREIAKISQSKRGQVTQ